MMHPYQYPGLHDKFQHLALSRSWPQLTARNAPATKIGMRTSVLGAVLCLVACGGSSSSGAPAQAAAISPLAGNYSTHWSMFQTGNNFFGDELAFNINVVPEPTSAGMGVLLLAGCALRRQRRRTEE